MKAYRVENQVGKHGIWRDFDGNMNPVFSKLTQGKCKDMPMEDSDFYIHEGKQWFSATDTPEKLKAWFSALDVVEMMKIGYLIYEFEIKSCRTVSEYEICFTRDNIISQKVIDPYLVYGQEYAIQKSKKELGDIDNFCKMVCNYCTANDWYCPTECDALEKARKLDFDRIIKCYARHDGDLCKVIRYIKTTKLNRLRGGY